MVLAQRFKRRTRRRLFRRGEGLRDRGWRLSGLNDRQGAGKGGTGGEDNGEGEEGLHCRDAPEGLLRGRQAAQASSPGGQARRMARIGHACAAAPDALILPQRPGILPRGALYGDQDV